MKKTLFLFLLSCLAPLLFGAENAKLTPEELVRKHLESIGTPEARAAASARGVDATVKFQVKQGGAGQITGTAKLGSDGRKERMVMRFNSQGYLGEDFVTDGSKTDIASLVSGKRSLLGAFFNSRPFLVQDGLVGGVLSTAWPLLHLNDTQPKLRYNGLKKVEGRELHEMRYEPRKSSGDFEVRLYFDPATYRHVLTIYEMRVLAPRSTTTGTSSGGAGGIVTNEGRQLLLESFSDFQVVDGITLPTKWVLDVTNETSQSSSKMAWEITVTGAVHGPIDASVFKR